MFRRNEWMKITRNKAVTLVTIILLSLMVSSIFTVNVSAHNPAINIRTWTQVAVAPDPVGVNQDAYLLFWLTQAPPGGATDSLARWQFNVSVTNPSNVTTSLGTFFSDSSGYASTTFKPDATGTWTVTVNFPKTVFTLSSTADEQVYTNDTFLASTASRTFTVQTAAVKSPLPNEYAQSADWFQLIGSGYLGQTIGTTVGGTVGRSNAGAPVFGPLSAHVLWTRPEEPGGIVGGSNIGVPGQQYFTGSSYWMRFQTYGIMGGYFYYRAVVATTGDYGNLYVVSLRDGSIVRQAGTSSLNPGYSCNGVNVLATTGATFTPTDPATLTTLPWSVTNVPTGTLQVGSIGERLIVSFTSTGSNLTCWNSSRVIVPGLNGAVNGGLGKYYDFNVTTTLYNKDTRAWEPFIVPQRTILNAYPGQSMCTGSYGTGYNNNSMTFWCIDLRPGHEGQIIGNGTFYQRSTSAGHYVNPKYYDPINHIVAICYKELRAWRGCDLNTVVNTAEKNATFYDSAEQAQMDYFGYLSNMALGTEHDLDGWTEYGHLYSSAYGGILYCYNTKGMTLNWTYGSEIVIDKLGIPNSTALGVNAVYANAPTFIGGIANGKIYTFATEHSVNTPIYKGAKIRCIDAYTGAEVFTVDGWVSSFFNYPAIVPPAYGYLIFMNSYDQQFYALAKGPSATSVSASDQVTAGNKVLIKGTVMDVSPGLNQTGIASRFPLGAPAVCDENVSAWMECIYMQRPRPENTYGVNVTISIMSLDGVVTDVGTATSDSTGYFNFLWTPPSTGTYTVLASYKGSNSYYPSYAQTSFNVESAPVATVTPSPTPLIETDSYILDFTAAIVAVIVLAGVAIILMLRRRP
jgi:hypothetical protein